MAHALIIAILYCFYRPKRHPKVVESKFDSTNHDVICFCLVVAFTTLHIVKFGVHAVLSLAHEYDNRMQEINNAGIELPLVARDSLSRNDNTGGVAATGNIAEDGGMCARCIANMVNNNSHIPPPPPTPTLNNQNNNETSSSQPQGESEQVRNARGNAVEQMKADENENTAISSSDDHKARHEGDLQKQKSECSGEDVKCDLAKISTSTVIIDCQESQSVKNLPVETRIVIIDPCN